MGTKILRHVFWAINNIPTTNDVNWADEQEGQKVKRGKGNK